MKSNGSPCGNKVVPGMTRCAIHGGMSPVAVYRAQQQLALLRIPAIEVMFNALETLNRVIDQFNEDTCVTCGYPKTRNDGVKEIEYVVKACVGAARTVSAILDRTGIGPTTTLEVKQSDGNFDLRHLTPSEKFRLVELLAQIRALKKEVRDRVLASSPMGSDHIPLPDSRIM